MSDPSNGITFRTIQEAMPEYRISDDLVRGLEIVAEIVATGAASPPFPGGFQLLPPATAALPEPSYG